MISNKYTYEYFSYTECKANMYGYATKQVPPLELRARSHHGEHLEMIMIYKHHCKYWIAWQIIILQ